MQAGSQITSRAGVHHLHHHADNVVGGAKLAVDTGGGDFTEEVFINVAGGITVMELDYLVVDAIQSSVDLDQYQWRGNFKDGVIHVLGVGAGLITVESLDKGEYPLLCRGIYSACGEIVEH